MHKTKPYKMKNFRVLKNSMLIAVAATGLHAVTSCESCSRKDEAGNNQTAGTHDTVYIDTCMSPHDSLMKDGASGTGYVPMGSRSGSGNAASGATPSGGSNGSGTSAGGSKSTLTQEEIDSRVENSSSQATKNGKPINSGGTSGTGSGTGTGSTGNNSRVTTKEDQLKN